MVDSVARMANFTYIRQHGHPTGSARSVLNAQHLLKKGEPFFVFYADDFFRAKIPRATQLLDAYRRTGKSTISLIEIDPKDAYKYGIVEAGKSIGEETYKISRLIEKPEIENAPSNYASVGGYLLTPDILPYVAKTKLGNKGEISLPDALDEFAQKNDVYGRFIDGIWHDTGDQLRYVEAQVDLMLEMPEFAPRLQEFLKNRLGEK